MPYTKTNCNSTSDKQSPDNYIYSTLSDYAPWLTLLSLRPRTGTRRHVWCCPLVGRTALLCLILSSRSLGILSRGIPISFSLLCLHSLLCGSLCLSSGIQDPIVYLYIYLVNSIHIYLVNSVHIYLVIVFINYGWIL